jgi:hypothetical protein
VLAGKDKIEVPYGRLCTTDLFRMDIDTSNPYENWQRLLHTRDYLSTNPKLDANFYRVHAFLIQEYIGVIRGTPDVSQETVPYFQYLLDQYSTSDTFDAGIYLMAVSKLIDTKENSDIDDDMQDAINSLMIK